MKQNDKTIRYLLGLLHLFMAISCFDSGFYGMSGAADLPSIALLKNSPFKDYFIPSLFLFVIVGGFSLTSALLVYKHHRNVRIFSFITGVLLIAWIAIQISIIGYQSWMQIAVGITALVIILLSMSSSKH